MLSDLELIKRLREEDRDAFNEIYRRHAGHMFSAAYNVLRHREIAEDAVHEVFLFLWKRRRHLDIQSLQSYLTQSVRYQVKKALMDHKRDEDFFSRLAAITREISAENPARFREIQEIVQALLLRLPEDQRLIFRLSREQNLTYPEIASHLKISVKTVEKKISQSLRGLRLYLDRVVFLAGICLLG